MPLDEFVRPFPLTLAKSKSIKFFSYKPISNLAANFLLRRKASHPQFERKQPITGWTYGPTTHQGIVISQPVAKPEALSKNLPGKIWPNTTNNLYAT